MKNKKDFVPHENHPKPITRRDFVAQGLIKGSSWLALPSILDIVLHRNYLYGANCTPVGGAASANLIPMVVIDCQGGPSLSGSFLPMLTGGVNPLSSYNTMAIPDGMRPTESNLNRSFGVPFYMANGNAGDPAGWQNKLAEGIVAGLPSDVISNTRGGSIAVATQDDSKLNPINPMLLAHKAGLSGTQITGPLGRTTGSAGGESISPPLQGTTPVPLRVRSVDDVMSAVGIGGALTDFSQARKEAIVRSLASLNEAQKQKLQGMTFEQQFNELSECGILKLKDYAPNTGALAVDPRLDAGIAQIYGLTQGQGTGMIAEASVIYNALKKNSGPGTLEVGGCDYHNRDRLTIVDPKDLEIGQTINRVLRSAKVLNTPVFISLIADGAVQSQPNSREWSSDSGSRGLLLMFYYNPTGSPRQIRTQLGGYTEGQVVDTKTTYIGGTPMRAGWALFLNWMAINGRVAEFSNFVKTNDFDPKQIDAHLIFG